MKIIVPNKVLLLFIFVAAFFLCGAAKMNLADIQMAVMQEDFQKAEGLAQAFIDGKPVKKDLDEALYYLGISQIRLNHYSAAKNTFNLLISGFPRKGLHDKAYLGYVDALYLDGEYAGALKIAEELLIKSPHSEYLSLVYLKLGRANLKLAQWQKAKEYLNKIISEFPKSLEAHTARQLLQEEQYFAVQVGAFLEQERAQRLVSDLEKKGEYAYVLETTDRSGKKFYRVRVGKLALLDEAQKLKDKLSQLGYPTAIFP